jgi:hypothetical protein
LVSPGTLIALKQTVGMAMVPKTTNEIDKKNIIDTFLEAAHNKASHHRWMTFETWAELINHNYLPPIDKRFSSDNLLERLLMKS